ncbi:MAG: hypothetical protein R3B07_06445 [Polyangiaceae bacterium]
MTEPIRQSNARHYDYERGLCKDESEPESGESVQPGATSSTSRSQHAAVSSSPALRDPGSQLGVAGRLAASVSAKQPRDPGLCERRLRTNDFLCKVLGGAVAYRAPGAAKIFAGAVAGECVHVFQWLEENAPGGACGDQ